MNKEEIGGDEKETRGDSEVETTQQK